MELYKSILLLISLPALLTFSAESICVPRNGTVSGVPPPSFSPAPSLPSVDAAIQKVCDVTAHPIECITSILPFPDGHTDPISVLLLEIKALGNQTQQAIDKATNISKDSSTSSLTVTCLDTCIEMYQTAIDDLKSAVDAITARDLGKLTSVLSAVYTDIDSCSDTFDEQPDLDSPMEETDAGLRKLCSNTLAITADLVHF